MRWPRWLLLTPGHAALTAVANPPWAPCVASGGAPSGPLGDPLLCQHDADPDSGKLIGSVTVGNHYVVTRQALNHVSPNLYPEDMEQGPNEEPSKASER